VVVSELEGLLPRRAAALPDPLAELTPGMAEAEARAVLDRARVPNARVLERKGERSAAFAAALAAAPAVMVTVITSGAGRVLEVDVTLPGEAAVPLVTTAWGEPDAVDYLDGGRSVSRWTPATGPWWAELRPDPDGEANLLRFLPPGQPSSDPIPPPASH
jgi:hypothetical protein